MGRRGGARIPQFAYICRSSARCRPAGVSAPAGGPNTHARNGDPMSAPIPYERFGVLASEAFGLGPVYRGLGAIDPPVRGS